MNDFSNAIKVTASGLHAQATRLRHLSENIANADTPGYQRKTIAFEAVRARTGEPTTVSTRRVLLDPTDGEWIFEPGHPLADESGFYEGSNVNLLIEMADSREAQRTYEANLKMFEQTKEMARGLYDLLRR